MDEAVNVGEAAVVDDSSVGAQQDALNDDDNDDHDEYYDDDEDDDDDDYDDWEVETSLSNRPIVVGYAFGPKKMSTMGVVMAEASKTKLSTTLLTTSTPRTVSRHEQLLLNNNQDQGSSKKEEPEQSMSRNDNDNKNSSSDHPSAVTPEPESTTAPELTQARLSCYQPDDSSMSASNNENHRAHYQSSPQHQNDQDNIIFVMDGHQQQNSSSSSNTSSSAAGALPIVGLRNIVRHFRSSCSSIAEEDVSTSSTGTRTASTATTYLTAVTTSGGSFTSSHHQKQTPGSSTSNRSTPSSHTRSRTTTTRQYPIRVSFVPLDPEIPLEEQHGGIDIILHKLTEDILCLSQLSMEHDQVLRANSDRERSTAKSEKEDIAVTATPLEKLRALGLSSASSTSSLSAAEKEKVAAIRRVDRLLEFRRSKGSCCLVDDPICVQKLMSRADISQTLEQCLKNVTSTSGMAVGAPKYLVVMWPKQPSSSPSAASCTTCSSDSVEWVARSLERANMTFPLIVKPLIAAGTKASHAMAILTQPSALENYFMAHQKRQQQQRTSNCLLQVYCNHDALLYKVYVLGDYVSVHKRRSLPNLPRDERSTNDFVEFDSQRPYPRFRDFGYPSTTTARAPSSPPSSTTTSVTAGVTGIASNHSSSSINVTAEEVRPIVDALKKAFGLEIFGFDVLITSSEEDGGDLENDTDHDRTCDEKKRRRMLVVDVNYFPSYKEVPNFPALLAKYLTDRAVENRREAILRATAPSVSTPTSATAPTPPVTENE